MTNLTPTVFLDRDGTLIHDAHYLQDTKDLVLFHNSAAAIKKLNENNILAILVTNQSGVARGLFSEETVVELNCYLSDLLKEENDSHIDGFYYCPHHKNGNIEEYSIKCNCRKPKTGMIDAAVKDFENIDLSRSYVIGDKKCDIDLAKNANIKSVLVRTGYGKEVEAECDADYVADDIKQAVEWILQDLK